MLLRNTNALTDMIEKSEGEWLDCLMLEKRYFSVLNVTSTSQNVSTSIQHKIMYPDRKGRVLGKSVKIEAQLG